MELSSLSCAIPVSTSAFLENQETFDIITTALDSVYNAKNHNSALQKGLQEVVRLTGARRGVLLIRPRDNNDMYPLFTYGGGLAHSYKLSEFGGLLGGWVLSWPQAEAVGWVSLPLENFGDSIGAIYLDRVAYSGPNSEQKRLAVEILTRQLGLILTLVVENSELIKIAKEKQTSLEMLAAAGQIGQRLNASLNMKQAIADFVESCRFLLDAERCSVLMVDWDTEALRLWGGDDLNNGRDDRSIPGLEDSIAGWVARTGESALVPDISLDPRQSERVDLTNGSEFCQVICVPLSVQGRVLGVVEVVNKLNGNFDEFDLTLLQLLASSASITMENVQRYTLQEAELKQKAELYSVASHGLRSPLMSIITWLDWILETGVENDLHKARLEEIRSQTFNLARFVGEILDMSRIEVGNIRLQMKPIALVPFIKRNVAVFELRAPTHRFEIEVVNPIPPVRVDETQLAIVLDHLMENAVKYSPAGSIVRIKIAAPDERVIVSVCDQGVGIPPEEIENLFTRFYQGRQHAPSGHSLGLGLYISKKLVETQGGEIWVDSEIERGSNFTFTLLREDIGD